jgi:hypothetical protein
VSTDALYAEYSARKEAASELVGTVGALLRMAERLPDGTVRIDLRGSSLTNVVDTFNRATHGDPFSADDLYCDEAKASA